ncbi:uncharacterized protein LOC128386669 [Panonychus citri]|uniref:uncharacterized protein LOC128386669 n=1 Tax=Panonychus citri TaxID=50023 RepID=UPI002306F653|nr:uncharacterized protein LOC128386669 [Panonychus citri]
MIKVNVFILLLTVYIINHSSAAPNKPKGNLSCPEQLKEVDRIFKVLLLISKRRLLPKDDAKHTEYCKDVTSLGKKVNRYSKCEKPFAAQVLTILSNGVKKPIKYICNEKKQVSMENFGCMTDQFIDQLNEKESYLIKNLKYITNNASSAEALPLFCCSMVDFLDSLTKIEPAKCSSSPNVHTGKFIHQRISSGAADVLDLVCSTYKNVKTCDEKIPSVMTTLRTPAPKGFSIDKEPFATYFIGAVTKMS